MQIHGRPIPADPHGPPGDHEDPALPDLLDGHGAQDRHDGHDGHGVQSRHGADYQEDGRDLDSDAALPPGAAGGHGPHEFSVPEASLAVGLSISTIRRLIQSGKLRARFERGDKGQNRYFIATADLVPLAALGQALAPRPWGRTGPRRTRRRRAP